MQPTQTLATREFTTLEWKLSWRDVLRLSAGGELLLLLLTVVALHDLLAAALAVILLIGASLIALHRRMYGFWFEMIARVIRWRLPEEIAGAFILGCLFADIGFYTLTGTATNLWMGASGTAILLPASLAAFALTGFVAAVMCVFARKHSAEPSRAAVNFVVAIFLVSSVVLGIGLLRGQAEPQVELPTDIKLGVENLAYSTTNLTAHPGRVTIVMENHDLFWHTFTIDERRVDLKVPMQAREQITFDAPPGIYTFHCTIPGHELLGMRGTLTLK